MKFFALAGSILACSIPLFAAAPEAELVEVRKIRDAAPHNAFTDLLHFKNQWWCVFREGKAHVSHDGALRVITSDDGREWKSEALMTHPAADLRDAKITVARNGQLMLSGAAAWHHPAEFRHQTLAWFSSDGRQWTEPVKIGESNVWLWRTTWHKGAGYGVGYATDTNRFVRLYRTTDGRKFDTLVPNLFGEGQPNEATLLFQPDDSCLCLLRRDGKPSSGQLGIAKPPYTNWAWKDLGVQIGGPNIIRLPDGRLIAAVRLYDGGARTSLAWIDANAGRLTEFLKLPSGGDTSYAGLVWHEGLLWVSYYSAHEGKASIYLAKVKFS